jgi:hypothetical protein
MRPPQKSKRLQRYEQRHLRTSLPPPKWQSDSRTHDDSRSDLSDGLDTTTYNSRTTSGRRDRRPEDEGTAAPSNNQSRYSGSRNQQAQKWEYDDTTTLPSHGDTTRHRTSHVDDNETRASTSHNRLKLKARRKVSRRSAGSTRRQRRHEEKVDDESKEDLRSHGGHEYVTQDSTSTHATSTSTLRDRVHERTRRIRVGRCRRSTPSSLARNGRSSRLNRGGSRDDDSRGRDDELHEQLEDDYESNNWTLDSITEDSTSDRSDLGPTLQSAPSHYDDVARRTNSGEARRTNSGGDETEQASAIQPCSHRCSPRRHRSNVPRSPPGYKAAHSTSLYGTRSHDEGFGENSSRTSNNRTPRSERSPGSDISRDCDRSLDSDRSRLSIDTLTRVDHTRGGMGGQKGTESDGNRDIDDDDDQCILSVESQSAAASSDVKRTRSYIINEPLGNIVDKFVEASYSSKQSRSVATASASATSKDVLISASTMSSRKASDRLACNFSVEPLSPLSEMSRGSARKAHAEGILEMLERYLPEDVSDAPLVSVFDHYLPTFTSSPAGSTFDHLSSGHASSSSTSHPLRFVNELALAPSEDPGNKKSPKEARQPESLHPGNSDSTATNDHEKTVEGTEGEADESSKLGSGSLRTSETERDLVFDEEGISVTYTSALSDDPQAEGETIHVEIRSKQQNCEPTADDDIPDNQSKIKLRTILAHTSIQIVSPKYRGWKPEELEVVLLETPQSSNLETLPTAATETSTHSSCALEVGTTGNYSTSPSSAGMGYSTSPSSAGMGSSLSIPPITATFSYNCEQDMPLIPGDASTQYSDDEESDYHLATPNAAQHEHQLNTQALETRLKPAISTCRSARYFRDAPFSGQQRTPATQPLQPRLKPANSPSRPAHFFTDTHSSVQQRTPASAFRGGHVRAIKSGPQKDSKAGIQCTRLSIRRTRSEDIPFSSQTRSFLGAIEEQTYPEPMEDPYCCNLGSVENKENHSASDFPLWPSSLESLRQLKATTSTQRQFLRRLVAERNGAIATTSAVRTKSAECSEKYRNIISGKDHEIEGLRRANRILRVHVAQAKATPINPDATPSHHTQMTQLTRKLHDLDENGAVVDKEQLKKEAFDNNDDSKLYRSEHTVSSEFLSIDNCVFELTTKEVTTLAVSVAHLQPISQERRDNNPSNTDHEVQVAIAKIVEKETAFLQQKMESLERQLENEIGRRLCSCDRTNEPRDEDNAEAPENHAERICAPDSREYAAHLESDGNANSNERAKNESGWKADPHKKDPLSKRLDKAIATLEESWSENQRLKQELQQSRSAYQEFKDNLSKQQGETITMKKKFETAMRHKEKELEYYKQQALSIEESTHLCDSAPQTTAMRELVDSLQKDYAEAERRRVEATSKCADFEKELNRAKRDLECRHLDVDDLMKKTEQLFAAKMDCDEKIFLLETKLSNNRSDGDDKSHKQDDLIQHYKRSVTRLEKEVQSPRTSEKETASSTEDEVASLRELVEHVRRDFEAPKHNRNQVSAKRQDLEGRLDKFQNEMMNWKLDTQVVEGKELHATTEAPDNNSKASVAQLRLDMERRFCHSELIELAEARAKEMEKSKNTTTHEAALQREIVRLMDELVVVCRERDIAAASFEASSNELSKMRLDLESCRKDRHSVAQDFVNTKREKERLAEEVQQLQVTQEDYEGRLTTLRSELIAAHDGSKRCTEENNDCIEQYRQQIEHLEATFQSMKNHHEETQQASASTMSFVAKLQEDLETQSGALEEARQIIASKEECIQKCQRDMQQESERARMSLQSKENLILDLQRDLLRVENERDAISATWDSVTMDLERANLDLESRILDNTELSLRIEQLFAAKEECEEKMASMEGGTQLAPDESGSHWLKEKEEAYFMAQMHIATLQSEVEELREQVKVQQNDTFSDYNVSDDVYRLKREKQEAVAKCDFLAKENEKIAAMLESTRDDLGQSIIKMSRLEMDLDDASSNSIGSGIRSTKFSNFESEARINFLSSQNDMLSTKIETALLENKTLRDKVTALNKGNNKKFELEKQRLLLKIRSIEVDMRDKDEFCSRLQHDKQDLVSRMIVLEEESQRRAEQDLSSTSEKRAMMDEIRRLEELHSTSDAKMSKQQAALKSAREEISVLKGELVRKRAQEQTRYAAEEEIARLHNHLLDLQEKLRYCEESSRSSSEKLRNEVLEKQMVAAELERAEFEAATHEKEADHLKLQISDMEERLRRVATSEKEASHLKLQISDMEQKLCRAEISCNSATEKLRSEEIERETLSVKYQFVEAELKRKQDEMAQLSLELDRLLTENQAKSKVKTQKPHDELDGERRHRVQLKQAESRITGLNAALAASQEKEIELLRAMTSTKERDKDELLSLREHVSALQKDLQFAEEARKSLLKENDDILERQKEAARRLEEKNIELEQLLEQATFELEERRSELEQLSRSFRLPDQPGETPGQRHDPPDGEDAAEREIVKSPSIDGVDKDKHILSSQLANTLATLDKNKTRITQLELFLQKTLAEQDEYVNQITMLHQALSLMQSSKSNQSPDDCCCQQTQVGRSIEVEISLDHDAYEKQRHTQEKGSVPTIIAHKHDSASISMLDQDEETSACDEFGLAVGVVSVNSKVAMSVSSSVATPDIVEKHSLYARKVIKQLGLASEREEEVSRAVSRKLSLLIKEVSKLCGPNVDRSLLDEASALSGSVDYFLSASALETREFDLECRLADVAQLGTMLELLIVDKKKSEHKMKALFQANRDYLIEVKGILSEKNSVLQRQGEVIETLREELVVLHARDKVGSRTLISEITLLDENLSYLQHQFDQDDVIREQAENRLEMALKEHRSLEVGLKQNHSERHHCQKRLPKLIVDLASFQVKMEARVEKLKTSEPSSERENQDLIESANHIKIAVEDFLSYYFKKQRKELRVQTIRSVSSDTGDAEYFITLNDYDYLELELAGNSEGSLCTNKTGTTKSKQVIKARANTQQRFVC